MSVTFHLKTALPSPLPRNRYSALIPGDIVCVRVSSNLSKVNRFLADGAIKTYKQIKKKIKQMKTGCSQRFRCVVAGSGKIL